MTVTLRPAFLRAASSLAGIAWAGLTPYPAARLSPRIASFIGAVCAFATARASHKIAISSELTAAAKRPYPVLRFMFSLSEPA